MNDAAIVTCFYTNLHGTKYGGRSYKEHQYLMSLLSLLKITNADFHIYCDPLQEEMLRNHIEPHRKEGVYLIPYDLENFYMKDLFAQYKNFDEAQTSQRCQEIQYLKTYWMSEIKNYEWLFWIDVGISYSNLIPNKHLISNDEGKPECYNSDLFTNDLLEGMKIRSEDKLLIFCINNNVPSYYRHCLLEYYGRYQDQIFYHTIAGIFGGRKNTVYKFHEMFYNLAVDVIETRKEVHDEECIYNILWDKNLEFFADEKFETWWHEDNAASHNPNDPSWVDYIVSLRAFYNVLEDLIELSKNRK